MKISQLIEVLQAELAARGDAELVSRCGEVYESVTSAAVFKTPYRAPEGTAYLQMFSDNVGG